MKMVSFTVSMLATVGCIYLVSGAADFTVVNNCNAVLWIEGRAGGGPIPGQSSTVTRLNKGQSVGYTMPAGGLSSTRFWAKYGCNDQGRECRIGDQMQYWPSGGCPTAGCTPPIDSLFEATWGCKSGSCDKTTWFDTSQVDGYTIPYLVTLQGDTGACDNGKGLKSLDGSKLDLDRCPSNEDITANGRTQSIVVNGRTIPLNNVNLRYHDKYNNATLGCASPCAQMSHLWNQNPGAMPTIYYCCPTPNPNNCQISQGCITSAECRAGPVATDKYTTAIHTMTSNIYAYAYDDGVGLHTCPAGAVTFTMEFCPPGSPPYPGRE